MTKTTILCGLAALALSSNLSAATPTPYGVVARVELGVATHWDYTAVDPSHHRLYVTRGDHLEVVDLPSAKVVGEISPTPGVHGVAFDLARGLGFSSNGKANSVSVFDLDTLEVKAEIPLKGEKPDAMVFEAAAGKLYVFNGHSDSVDVIDSATLKSVGTIKTSADPEFAVSDGKGRIYFNLEDHPGVEVIDTATDKVVATWPLEGCDGPTGIAMDVVHGLLFSTCQNHVVVATDVATGKRDGQYKIGGHPDAVLFDPHTNMIITACGGEAGSLNFTEVVSATQFVDRQNLTTAPGARTLAMDPADGRVYTPTVADGHFVLIVAAPKK
ncbi:MAG: YncE family protein [Pseudomonadota bacterium]|nr:YncE family protein [Pseudomonadota bacterium]